MPPSREDTYSCRHLTFAAKVATAILVLATSLTACKTQPDQGKTESTSTQQQSGGTQGSPKLKRPEIGKSEQKSGPAPEAKLPTPEDKIEAQKLAEQARDQLDGGNETEAREFVLKALTRDPQNAMATSFDRQLRLEPLSVLKEATGSPLQTKDCDYKVAPGDTLSRIAERAYRGDRTLFVSLAKLNGVATPKALQAKQVIRVPALDCAKLELGRTSLPVRLPTQSPTTTQKPSAPASESETAYKEGIKALELGDTGKAYRQFKRVLTLDPGDKNAQAQLDGLNQERDEYYRKCTKARLEKDYKATMALCGRVLEIDPEHENAKRKKQEAERLFEALQEGTAK